MSASTGESRGRKVQRRSANVAGIVGELFLTAGVIILLYLGWELWLNDIIVGSAQDKAASTLSQQWKKGGAPAPASPTPSPSATDNPAVIADPVVSTPPADNQAFATLIVPRLGADYARPIAQDVRSVELAKGVGHYVTSQMPGEVGNFAVAAHRTTHGKPFNQLAQLQVGDSIYVETKDGWYQYIFRNSDYVRPNGVGVLLPVPDSVGVTATDRFITMTTCNPMFSSSERLVAFGVFSRWYPRADGPPSEIAALVGSASG